MSSRKMLETATSISSTESMKSLMEFVKQLSIVRVPSTSQHKLIQELIISSFPKDDWVIEKDEFSTLTPFGNKHFTNIIATPHIDQQLLKASHGVDEAKIPLKSVLVLAAHYDSKWFESGKFVGATDSAVSCAIMISIANHISSLLKEGNEHRPLLKLVFFDGEEAFVQWTESDSLYRVVYSFTVSEL